MLLRRASDLSSGFHQLESPLEALLGRHLAQQGDMSAVSGQTRVHQVRTLQDGLQLTSSRTRLRSKISRRNAPV